jgi:hypothetical protein
MAIALTWPVIGLADPAAQPAAEPAPEQPIVMHDITEIEKDFRAPTAEEIKKLGDFWPKVPEKENAAYWFALAASRLHTEGAPPGSLLSDDEAYSYAGDLAALEKWVEGNHPALQTMREGFKQKTYCAPIVVYAPMKAATFDIGHFGCLRRLARASCDAGVFDELKGRPDAAADTYYSEHYILDISA